MMVRLTSLSFAKNQYFLYNQNNKKHTSFQTSHSQNKLTSFCQSIGFPLSKFSGYYNGKLKEALC